MGFRELKDKSTSSKTPLILSIISILTVVLFAGFGLAQSSNIVKFDRGDTHDWKDPVSSGHSAMPVKISSGSKVPLRVELDTGRDFGDWDSNDDPDLRWYRKSASDTSWTEVESYGFEVTDPLDADSKTISDGDYAHNNIFGEYGGASDTGTICESDGSKTILVEGNEHTILVDFASSGSVDDYINIKIDGVDYDRIYRGSHVLLGNDYGFKVERVDTSNDCFDYHDFTKYIDSNPSDGHYRYRPSIHDVNSKDYYFSSAYVNLGDGGDIPYVKKVTYEGQEINDLQSLSGVKEGGEFRVFVQNNEQDDYTISLVDRAAYITLQSADVNSNILETIIQELLNEAFPIWFQENQLTQGGDVTEVPFKVTDETSFLNLVGEQETFGFKITQGDGTRKTTDYTIQPDTSNAAPSISNVEWTDNCGSSSPITYPITTLDSISDRPECIAVFVSDTDTTGGHSVSVNVTQEYDNVDHEFYTDTVASLGDSDKVNGNTYFFNISDFVEPFSKIADSGTWSVDARVEESGNVDVQTVDWSVDWGNLSVDMEKPGSDLSVNNTDSFGMDLNINCSGGPECVNQNETASLYWDPAKPEQKNAEAS